MNPLPTFSNAFPKLSCFAILLFTLSFAQAQPVGALHPTYKEYHYKGQRYGWYMPRKVDPDKSYPLLVYLHGSRDTVSRELVYYTEASQKDYPVFVLTPKCEEPNLGWGDTWHDTHTPAMTITLQLIDSLVAAHHLDTKRLYLYGISMGGFGVFSVLAKTQGKFAAAYAVCGGSDTTVGPRLLQTPLWIFHGSDDDIVPVRLSRNIYKEIIRLGGTKTHYTEYPGVKHNSWENVAREKSLSSWLFSQKNK